MTDLSTIYYGILSTDGRLVHGSSGSTNGLYLSEGGAKAYLNKKIKSTENSLNQNIKMLNQVSSVAKRNNHPLSNEQDMINNINRWQDTLKDIKTWKIVALKIVLHE